MTDEGAPRGGTDLGDERSPRLGVFGGTFDPFHHGHLIVAQDVLEALRLDRVLFIPAGRPPHKEGERITPGELRLRMSRASVAEDPRFDVLDLEIRREGPSYTVDTLRELGAREPGAALFLLMGVDQWAAFGSWREPLEIARRAWLVIMTREGERASDVDPGLEGLVEAASRNGPEAEEEAEGEGSGGSAGAHGFATGGGGLPEVLEVPVTRIDLSSTRIRERAAEGRSIRYLVPEPVRRIIETEKLYR